MTSDKTGATTSVIQESGRFTISVDGTIAGFTEIKDRAGRRTFTHTEVDDAFQGRGLATILIGEALQRTRDAGLRIVPVCSMVADYVKEHSELDDVVDTADA